MPARTALTVRFPDDLLEAMREYKADDESLNDMIVTTMERELTRRQALAVHQEILTIRGQIKSRVGSQPDSTQLIHALREGDERHE